MGDGGAWSKLRRALAKNLSDLKTFSEGVLTEMGQTAPKLEDAPFVKAAFEGDIDLVSRLMAEGASLTQSAALPGFGETSALGAAVYQNHIDVARLLIDNLSRPELETRYGQQKYMALHIAAMAGADEICEALLGKGNDLRIPDSSGNTPLMLAVMNGRLSTVWIITDKARVAGQSKVLDETNNKGQTPLHVACELGELAMVSCLVKQGADANKPMKGWGRGGQTPLWVAATSGHADIVQTLLTSGTSVDIDMENRRGLTLLHLAVLLNHPRIVTLLMEHGADIETGHMRLDGGQQNMEDFPNPLLLSCAYGRPQCLQALLMAPAEDVSRLIEKPGRVDITAVVVEKLVSRVPESPETPMAWAVQYPCKFVRKSVRVMGIGGDVEFTAGSDAMDADHAECARILLSVGAGMTVDQLEVLRENLERMKEKGRAEEVVGRLEVFLVDRLRQCRGCGTWGVWTTPGSEGGDDGDSVRFCSVRCRTVQEKMASALGPGENERE